MIMSDDDDDDDDDNDDDHVNFEECGRIGACLHGGGGPQKGEVTCGWSPHLSCKRDQIKTCDYMDRRVTPPKRVTSPSWGSPPPYRFSVHHNQLNPSDFTLNQWYYCTKIHPCKSSNNECYLAFSHSTTPKVKLYLPSGWAKISIIKGPWKLLLLIFQIEVLILLQLIWINYLVNKKHRHFFGQKSALLSFRFWFEYLISSPKR